MTHLEPVLPPLPPQWEVGGLKLVNPLLLAPLAGVTIPPLRLLYARLGAGAVHTEMTSCSGLLVHDRKTASMTKVLPGEAPVVLQLFAGDGDTLERGAESALAVRRFPAVGINMACPMPKVLKRGAGSRLLSHPDVAFDMVRRLVRLGVPVWPKIRKCPEKGPLTTGEFTRGLLDAGAAMVFVHGRTPAQRYEGEADVPLVTGLARTFGKCIGASGDVLSPERAKEYLDAGCGAVLLARGAIADPFLFPRTLAFLGFDVHNMYRNPTPRLQATLLLRFGDEVNDQCGPRMAVFFMKRLLAGLFRGVRGIGEMRRAVAQIHEWPELRARVECWDEYFERGE